MQKNCGFHNDSFRDGGWHSVLTILWVWLLPCWLAPPGLAMQTTTETTGTAARTTTTKTCPHLPFSWICELAASAPLASDPSHSFYICGWQHSTLRWLLLAREQKNREQKGWDLCGRWVRPPNWLPSHCEFPASTGCPTLVLLALHWVCGHIRYTAALPQTPGGMHGWRTMGFYTQSGFHFTRGHKSLYVSASFPS